MKKVFVLFALIFLVASCVSYRGYIEKLYIGMPKERALSIMGKDYSIERMAKTEDGLIVEVFRFPAHPNMYPAYLLFFENGTLVEVLNDKKPQFPSQEIKVKHE